MIDLLLKNRDIGAVGTIRSTGHDPDYDRHLAGKRLEYLQKIFRNRGLTDRQIQLSVADGEGAPLELELQPIMAERSAGLKQ